jgi:hypothetical protein
MIRPSPVKPGFPHLPESIATADLAPAQRHLLSSNKAILGVDQKLIGFLETPDSHPAVFPELRPKMRSAAR